MRLKEYLEENGLTQRDFAKLIGVGHLTVWRYLQNETAPNHRKPSREVLAVIARVTSNKVLASDFGILDTFEESA